MQNDTLYNKVMKKILVIEAGIVEGAPVVTGANMKPSEVIQPGMLPVICFIHFYADDENDMYFNSESIGFDTGVFTISTSMITVIADSGTNTWVIAP